MRDGYYHHALGRAASELVPEIERYELVVLPSEGTIRWQNITTTMKPYTPKAICKREIRRLIRKAKEAADAEALKNQSTLFGDKDND